MSASTRMLRRRLANELAPSGFVRQPPRRTDASRPRGRGWRCGLFGAYLGPHGGDAFACQEVKEPRPHRRIRQLRRRIPEPHRSWRRTRLAGGRLPAERPDPCEQCENRQPLSYHSDELYQPFPRSLVRR